MNHMNLPRFVKVSGFFPSVFGGPTPKVIPGVPNARPASKARSLLEVCFDPCCIWKGIYEKGETQVIKVYIMNYR